MFNRNGRGREMQLPLNFEKLRLNFRLNLYIFRLNLYIYIYIYIYEEKTKENHNRVMSVYVIQTRVLYLEISFKFCSIFFALENINWQTFVGNYCTKRFVL